MTMDAMYVYIHIKDMLKDSNEPPFYQDDNHNRWHNNNGSGSGSHSYDDYGSRNNNNNNNAHSPAERDNRNRFSYPEQYTQREDRRWGPSDNIENSKQTSLGNNAHGRGTTVTSETERRQPP